MKKTLLPILSLCFGLSAFAQVENGTFEMWKKETLFQQPDMGVEVASSNYETYFETGQLNVNQVPHDDGTAMRLENIGQGDNILPAFFLTGVPPNQEGEMLVFDGGMSASDQNVSGLSMDLTYDIPAESPGFVIVQFKLANEPVGPGNMGPGTFYFPISGEKDWETEVFDFEQPVGTEFDQVVIGIACADLLNDDSPFMADAWLEVDNLEFVNSTDEIVNGDFENWAMVPPIELPVGVDMDIDPFKMRFFKSGDAYEGNHALGLVSVEQDGFVEASRAVMGQKTENGITPTINLNDEHSMVSFNYKYEGDGDMAQAKVIFFQEDSEDFIPVFTKEMDLQPTEDYTTVEYPFVADLEENFISPTKMAIEFTSSQEDLNLQAGSTLIIDNVQVNGTLPLAEVTRVQMPRVSAFPNPTFARVIFNFGVSRTGFYRLYNSQGFQMDYVQFQSENELIHDLSGLPSGNYVFRFYHNGGIETATVIKF